MRSRVQDIFADPVLGEKLKMYSSTEMEDVKLDFVSVSQTMVSCALLSSEWIDDGSLDGDEVANTGRKGLWRSYVDANFKADESCTASDEMWNSKLSQASSAVTAQWELVRAAAGVGGVSSWLTGGENPSELSADPAELA